MIFVSELPIQIACNYTHINNILTNNNISNVKLKGTGLCVIRVKL